MLKFPSPHEICCSRDPLHLALLAKTLSKSSMGYHDQRTALNARALGAPPVVGVHAHTGFMWALMPKGFTCACCSVTSVLVVCLIKSVCRDTLEILGGWVIACQAHVS